MLAYPSQQVNSSVAMLAYSSQQVNSSVAMLAYSSQQVNSSVAMLVPLSHLVFLLGALSALSAATRLALALLVVVSALLLATWLELPSHLESLSPAPALVLSLEKPLASQAAHPFPPVSVSESQHPPQPPDNSM